MQRKLVGLLLSVALTAPALAALKSGDMAPGFHGSGLPGRQGLQLFTGRCPQEGARGRVLLPLGLYGRVQCGSAHLLGAARGV